MYVCVFVWRYFIDATSRIWKHDAANDMSFDDMAALSQFIGLDLKERKKTTNASWVSLQTTWVWVKTVKTINPKKNRCAVFKNPSVVSFYWLVKNGIPPNRLRKSPKILVSRIPRNPLDSRIIWFTNPTLVVQTGWVPPAIRSLPVATPAHANRVGHAADRALGWLMGAHLGYGN